MLITNICNGVLNPCRGSDFLRDIIPRIAFGAIHGWTAFAVRSNSIISQLFKYEHVCKKFISTNRR